MLNPLRRSRNTDITQPPFDASQIEEQVSDVVAQFAPPAERLRHHRSAENMTELTTAAIQQQYEDAIKSLESMGAIVLARVHDLDTVKAQCMEAVTYIRETADMYRQDAARVADHIAYAHKLTEDVRNVCADMQSRIRAPIPTSEALSKVDEAVGKINSEQE